MDCVAELLESGTESVIVNVANVTDIDTSGLSAFVSAHISMARTSNRLKSIAPDTEDAPPARQPARRGV